jgi:ParB family transcriptional regulator, chromosome partitioning protein
VNKERRLGRGLEALLGRSYAEPPRADLALHAPDAAPNGEVVGSSDAAATGALTVDVRQIQINPFQPRRDFAEAEISSLADSLREHGLLQPLLVRCAGEGYQLIAGERRLRAAILAGWTQVPVQVREADDRQMAELAIVENLQRKDLNALEKAASFDRYLQQYGCTQEELAGRLNIDRSTIANLIRLLELPPPVQHAIRAGQVTQGHARALLPLGDERQQVEFCQRIQSEGLSVRATEELVQETIHAADAGPLAVVGAEGQAARRPTRNRGHQLAALEQELRAALGTKVSIRQSAQGRGRIAIQFSTREEFDRLRSHLTGHGPEGIARAG